MIENKAKTEYRLGLCVFRDVQMIDACVHDTAEPTRRSTIIYFSVNMRESM